MSRGGAVDLHSLLLGNRLVGNHPDCAAVETSGGLALTVEEPVMVAITGAVAEVVVIGGPAVGWGSPVVLPAGARLVVTRLLEGARVYVAVRGGLERAGNTMRVGPDPATPASSQAAARPQPTHRIRLWPGPRIDWFSEAGWRSLVDGPYTVAAASNRVGVRLIGSALERAVYDELPPEGIVEGAIQVPPDGQPIIMLADHPTTGGYPVIAVVDPDDLTHVAQLAPGATARFRLTR